MGENDGEIPKSSFGLAGIERWFNRKKLDVPDFDETENYPIPEAEVAEARDVLRIPKAEDPFGRVAKMKLIVAEDTHQPRSDPENEPTITVSPWKWIASLSRANRPKYGDYAQVRPVQMAAAVWDVKAAMLEEAATADQDEFVLLVNGGDRGADAETRNDMRYAFVCWAEMMKDVMRGLSSRRKSETMAAIAIAGDHEMDTPDENTGQGKRFGSRVWQEEHSLEGENPGFVQRVGNKQLVMAVNTTLIPFAHKNEIPEELEEWAKKQESIIIMAKRICEEEGRSLVVIGHDERLLNRMCAEHDINPAFMVYGHVHAGSISEKIFKGQPRVGIRTGARRIGAYGLEITQTRPKIAVVTVGDNMSGEGWKAHLVIVPAQTDLDQGRVVPAEEVVKAVKELHDSGINQQTGGTSK